MSGLSRHDARSVGERTLARIRWRLLPFLGLLYVVSYLDRVNVSFAKLTMNESIGIDDATYAFGAGIFFIGYFPVFWTFPTAFLTGTAAAGGIALINSFGNLAGYFGPQVVVWLTQGEEGYGRALFALGLSMLVPAAVVLAMGPAASPALRPQERTATQT